MLCRGSALLVSRCTSRRLSTATSWKKVWSRTSRGLKGGSLSLSFPPSPASSHCTSPSLVWRTTTRSWHRSPRFVSRMLGSQAGRNGWAILRSTRGDSGVFVRVLLDGTRRGGCEEHRPPSSTVAVMKTMSRWYPAHSRPLSIHFLHSGRWLSHCRLRVSGDRIFQKGCHLSLSLSHSP